MKQILKIAMLVLAVTSLWGCYEEPQPFDMPFVYICDENGGSSSSVNYQGNNILTEMRVYLSCKKFTDPIVVTYDVTVGDGLKEGVKLVGPGGAITLWIPSAMAYGAEGDKEKGIGANEMLRYEVNIVEVKRYR